MLAEWRGSRFFVQDVLGMLQRAGVNNGGVRPGDSNANTGHWVGESHDGGGVARVASLHTMVAVLAMGWCRRRPWGHKTGGRYVVSAGCGVAGPTSGKRVGTGVGQIWAEGDQVWANDRPDADFR